MWQDNFRTFTVDERKFPEPQKMFAELAELGVKCATNITPVISINQLPNEGYRALKEGREKKWVNMGQSVAYETLQLTRICLLVISSKTNDTPDEQKIRISSSMFTMTGSGNLCMRTITVPGRRFTMAVEGIISGSRRVPLPTHT